MTQARRPTRRAPSRQRKTGDPRRRLVTVGILVAMVMSLFAGRLLQLQGVEAAAYAATAEAERLRTVTIPATRGTITDANGVALATTVDAVTITADQTQIADPVAVAAALAPVLGEPIKAIYNLINGDLRFAYVAREVTPKKWDEVAALRLPGIYSEPTAKRVYPQGSLAAAVLGFVGSDGHGLEGLEYSLDSKLAGKDGQLTYESAAGGHRIPSADSVNEASVPGADVQLTIDRDIQFIAERAIRAKVKESDSDSGTVVAMDPRTGEVLALATYPSLNPRSPESAPEADRGNRAVTEIYEPGSTSKVMTMAAALDAGAVTPNSKVEVPPILYRGGDSFHDHSPHGTLHLTATGVLAQSSNIGMILIAERLGDQALYAYLRKFGMGSTSGLDFPGESAGILPNVNDWGPTNAATIAFGQGLSLNAVQSTSVFATIANNGVRVEPTVIAGTSAPDGSFTPAPAPQRHRVVSAEAAITTREMMETVVSDQGTAPMAQIPGYRVAGKTGTAERVDESCGCYSGYTASFIGFAPADKPAIVVSVTLQDPKGEHYGGVLGGPVFKRVTSFALQSQQVPPTATTVPSMRLTYRP
ncbi:MAG: penicillin-binding protein 2 [Actinomycetia bacterium]|nr:penicillin-binding protein 2 [Actinomycetes bacterium]